MKAQYHRSMPSSATVIVVDAARIDSLPSPLPREIPVVVVGSRAALHLASLAQAPPARSDPFAGQPMIDDRLDIWDFIEGVVENLSAQDRLLNEFRRAARRMLRASHTVFFLKERGGFRADRGDSFCPEDDEMVRYLRQHPAVLDGSQWSGPIAPLAQLAVSNWMSRWSVRLLVSVHENGRLIAIIGFGVRDDGKIYGSADHAHAVFLARLLKQFLSLATGLRNLKSENEIHRLGARYGPKTVILGPDETSFPEGRRVEQTLIPAELTSVTVEARLDPQELSDAVKKARNDCHSLMNELNPDSSPSS